jgi:hypothetical protein
MNTNSRLRAAVGHDNQTAPLFDTLLKPTQAAEFLGCSVRTLRRNREAWRVPTVMVGAKPRHSLASLIRWKNEREVS